MTDIRNVTASSRRLDVLAVTVGHGLDEETASWLRAVEASDRISVRRHHLPTLDSPLSVLRASLAIRRQRHGVVLMSDRSATRSLAVLLRMSGVRVAGVGARATAPSPVTLLGPWDLFLGMDDLRSEAGIARSVSRLAQTACRPGAGLRSDSPVSIVVTVLNEEATVGPLLSALLPRMLPADELVVVDGGSTDGTGRVLLARRASESRLRVLSAPATNIAEGRNRGIAAARHDLIACTDAGCQPVDGWLSALRLAFEEPLRPGLVAGVPRIAAVSALERAQALACYPHPQDLLRPSLLVRAYGRLFGQVFRPELPFARSVAFTRLAWTRAGGFPERLGWVEDGVFGKSVAAEFPCVASIDAEVGWEQRGSIRTTARMYFRYGIGAAQSGDRSLIARDVIRSGAYLLAILGAVRYGRRAAPALICGGVCYYSLPIRRVHEAGAGWRVGALVPMAMLIKDLGKVAGAVRGRAAMLRPEAMRVPT